MVTDPEGGIVRYQARSTIIYRQVINATGSFVWERLDGARALGEICAEMAVGFDEMPADHTALAAEIAQPSGAL